MRNQWGFAVILFCFVVFAVGMENISANKMGIAAHTWGTFADDIFSLGLGFFTAWWARGYVHIGE